MTRDERRAKCIEAMKATGRAAVDNKQFDNMIEQMFDSLPTAGACVVPVEATEEMINEVVCQTYPAALARADWHAMATAGDLTNPPETKP